MDRDGRSDTRRHRPPPPSVEADRGRFLHCPIQTSENDLPILRYDVHGGGKYFKRKLKVLKKREIMLSPLIIELPSCCVHVTPLSIPFPKENSKDMRNISSYHIIQLFSSKMKPKLQVDCLMSDENLYFAGFRRHVLELSERDIKKGVQVGPGNWYVFDNEFATLPDFIKTKATPLGMDSKYREKKYMTPGGSDAAMGEILFQLYAFEGGPHVLSREFIRATQCVMLVFCETRRSLGMLLECGNRMTLRLNASALEDLFHETIRMWGSYSGVVLEAKKDGTLSLSIPIDDTLTVGPLKKFKCISCLIGPNGELLILKFNASYLTMESSSLEQEIKRARRAGYAPNHFFDDQ